MLAMQLFVFDVRELDSPYVEKIWRTKSVPVESFISVAVPTWEMVVTSQRGKIQMTVRGPETKASIAGIPQDADFVGIQFRLGAFMPRFPLDALVDRWIDLPRAGSESFWLDSSVWQFPNSRTPTFSSSGSFGRGCWFERSSLARRSAPRSGRACARRD